MGDAALQWGTPEMLEDPFPFFEDARSDASVCPIPGRSDTVLVTLREDIEYILMHPDVFSTARAASAAPLALPARHRAARRKAL